MSAPGDSGAPATSVPRLGRLQVVALAALLIVPAVVAAMLAAPAFVCACTPTAPPSIESPVEGIVIGVDSAGLGDVRGFSVRTSAGQTIPFALGPLENPADFPPGHLADHQATSSPVRVYFRDENGQHVAYRLEDAQVAPTS